MTNADQFETDLRAALREAEESLATNMMNLKSSTAHPNSNEYKLTQWPALIASGRVMGLAEALSLWTGEEITPNLPRP